MQVTFEHSFLVVLTQGGPPPVSGQSVGDPCLDWRQTQEAVRMLAKAICKRKAVREDTGGVKIEADGVGAEQAQKRQRR